MRVVLQRVSSASVTIDSEVVGRIDRGLMLLVGIENADTAADGEWLADKITKLRIFENDAGKMNLSLLDLAALQICRLQPCSTSHLAFTHQRFAVERVASDVE